MRRASIQTKAILPTNDNSTSKFLEDLTIDLMIMNFHLSVSRKVR